MNAIDGTEHAAAATEGAPPSLLVLIIDTNPHAWSLLSPHITLSSAIAQLLIFLNAHLAFNNANRVAVLASHTNKIRWLYPSAANEKIAASTHTPTADANKYRPFALLEQELLANLRDLMKSTSEADLKTNGKTSTTTLVAGALTRALSYINRLTLSLTPTANNPHATNSSTSNPTPFDAMGANGAATATTSSLATHVAQTSHLNSRVLIVSTSGDLAGQYIPLMNLIFAAQHARIPVDVLKLAGDTVLLQQASYTTSGVFLSPVTLPSTTAEAEHGSASGQAGEKKQISILPTLLHAFLPDPLARTHLIPATGISVDFRAACFCHRKVVDIGYVCSICLSIFCAQLPVLEGGGCVCWTCGTKLRLDGVETGGTGQGGEVRKKKRKRVAAED